MTGLLMCSTVIPGRAAQRREPGIQRLVQRERFRVRPQLTLRAPRNDADRLDALAHTTFVAPGIRRSTSVVAQLASRPRTNTIAALTIAGQS